MIERWFRCAERGSRWDIEFMAGVSTFLALSYIFVVNPAILSQAGIPRNAVFFATVVTSAAATLVMGLWANLPYVLAPGMEINIYVAFYAVAGARLTWQEALGAVFWSGILFLLVTMSGIRRGILDSLPDSIKTGLGAAVGALLAAVAFRIAGLLVYDGTHLRGFGAWNRDFIVFAGATLVVFVLSAMRVRAAILISIGVGTAIAALMGFEAPSVPGGKDGIFAAAGAADVSILLRPGGWTVILFLFLVDFYGSVAKFIGLIRRTNVMRDGEVPRLREALLIDGVAATAGSLLGTTSVLVYAESGVGIAAGGRTGLTAVTAGIAMLGCLVAAPLLASVPLVATTGALLYVAWRLMPEPDEWRAADVWEWIAITGMVVIVVATFALDRALLFGLGLHLIRDIFRGVRLNAYAVASTALLLIGWFISN